MDDITTSGSSVKKVIKSVRAAGGKIVAVCVLVNRDQKLVTTKTIGAPFFPLATYRIPSYEASACPLCKKGIPISTQLGHGSKFIKLKTL
jgi:orotate phosphoribosyltransferase